jgi:hypothetical protein
MLTTEKFTDVITSLGADPTSIDMTAFLLGLADSYQETHKESFCLDATTMTYRFPTGCLLSEYTQFFRAEIAEIECDPEPNPVAVAFLVTSEVFDHTDVAFVQTAEVALDPAYGIYRLLNAVDEGQVLTVKSQAVQEEAVINEVAFNADMCNPIRSYKKGPIEVKTRPLLETLMMKERLDSMTGKNVTIISSTRYSNGVVKGRKDGI